MQRARTKAGLNCKRGNTLRIRDGERALEERCLNWASALAPVPFSGHCDEVTLQNYSGSFPSTHYTQYKQESMKLGHFVGGQID